jgi:5S rRNA maturation endonuclease (ribonuclease M5)
MMVACTGRTHYNKCEKCKLYHHQNLECPINDPLRGLKYSKWRNNSKSNISSYLYNYYKARKHIQSTGTIIIVEGPADVWRLEELGIHNSVALFGTEMSDEQQVLIEMSGALNVVILLDMDEPGRNACKDIKERLERVYRVFIPEMSVNDPGDYDIKIINEELLPILKGIQR